jgi:hypothetical protein
VDEGLPIAYQVLEKNVAVYASDGTQIGTVDHVVAAPEQDIFHGIVLRIDKAQHFVPAEQVASLHEFGVDLTIDAAAASSLPTPHGGAAVYRDHEPGVKGPSGWKHFVHIMDGHAKRDKPFSEER